MVRTAPACGPGPDSRGNVMNRLKSPAILFLFVLLLTPISASQAFDEVGIYFDSAYNVSQIEVTDVPATVTGYLVLHNPSSGYPVAGWECCIDLDGEAIFTSWVLEGQTINVLEPPCFMVGIGGEPLPASENVLLATFELLVTHPTPVIFSLDPVYYPSFPGEMAYLSGANADEILPMYPVTGYPEVASINAENPWPEVSTEALYFDIQPIGSTTTRTVNVSNVGGGYLHLNITLPDSTPDFSLPGLSGLVSVPSGSSVNIHVAFTPTQLGEVTSNLSLGDLAPDVFLHGVGREPVISWEVDGNLNFGDMAVGVESTRAITIFNTGEIPLPIDPYLGDCEGFFLVDPAPFVIQPGNHNQVYVTFAPPYAGEFACDLQLGTVVDPVPMTGSAHEAVTDWTVLPETLDFGFVAEGTSRTLSVAIQNTGETGIAIVPEVDDPNGYYQVTDVTGNLNLQPGYTLTLEVTFHPLVVGQFDAQLTLGEIIPPVPMTGISEEANPQCQVVPTELDFGTVNVGGGTQRFFTVSNTGNVPLEVTPGETSDHFFIQPYPVTIEPGTNHQFMVLFAPMAAGDWECDISLGGSGCASVHCLGTGVGGPPPGDDNLVGIFFDPDYLINETFIDGVGPVMSYLVLVNPSDPMGVRGWECRNVIDGPAIFIGATLLGQAINIGNYPDFIVGLAEPLPPTPNVMLATLQYFVLEPYTEIYLNLLPTSIPSIPGYMAFLAGSNPESILPMYPYTGYSEVAYINVAVTDVERPAEPVIQANGGQVRLSWDLPAGSYEGYHVYRRDETGGETRLTGQPGDISGDTVIFTDQPQGFEAGALLFYSYSLVKNGVETARSPEVQYEVTNVPAQLTRLLPNIPNPFNPQTTIRFELSTDGSARVSIFDVSGRLVRTLAEGSLAAGSHERVWQGKDNNGRQVPSGAYYVRLETPSGLDHRKIMLLK